MPYIKKFSIYKTKYPEIDIDFNSCSIYFLDENKPNLVINLKNNTLGSSLLDEVFLNLGKFVEKDYFSLRFSDKKEQQFWLNLDKPVIKQLKSAKTNSLYFLVKHYPGEPLVDLVEELAQYQLYLQLRKDLYSEHLIVNEDVLPKLISLVIQGEMEDMCDPSTEIILNAVNSLKIVKNITNNMLKRVCEAITTLNWIENREMESQFIQIVSQLESYGVEPNRVIDPTGKVIFLGMNHQGICTFIGEKRISIYYWENISKMMFISKLFIMEINFNNTKRKLEFKFKSEKAANAFWMWAMDRQNFMTLNNSSEARKVKSNSQLFRRKVKHRFSGRSKKEVTESCLTISSVSKPPVIRTRNPVTISRSNSAKAVCRDSMVVDTEQARPNSYATLPKRSISKKPISEVEIDFQNNKVEDKISVDSGSNDNSISINDNSKIEPVAEPELENIIENQTVECMEPVECLKVQSLFSNLENYNQHSEPAMNLFENEIRERQLESVALNAKLNDQAINVSRSNELLEDCSRIESEYHYHHTDGMFFIKFVILTTLILLVVMVTSLVAYYYYRSASIADLKKQKYSSEWNKNIDLEAIKRFVLRNDAP